MFFLIFVLHLFFKSNTGRYLITAAILAVTSYGQNEVKQTNENVGLPLRLVIPKIGIDAAIEYVGLTRSGAMGIPKKLDNVAWFELGVRPGEIGTAVIDGHYGWKSGKSAVFDDLYTIQKGDIIYVKNDKGEDISFVVHKVQRYDPQANTGEIFTSSDGKSHLNLITCGGVWDKTIKGYSSRLVVFSDKEVK